MKSVSLTKLVVAFATFVAAGSFFAGHSASVPSQNTSTLTDAERQAPLFAIARTGDFILAANSNGFFRVGRSSTNWERVSFPAKMPFVGMFAVSQSNSNWVYFWPQSFFSTNGSLYVSRDTGKSWNTISDGYGFRFVYPNRDGRLYAIVHQEVTVDSIRSFHSRLLLSENEGKTWKDISQNMLDDLHSIFSDPKFSNRVCVVGGSMRRYIFDSPDDSYSKWTATPYWAWRNDSKTDDEFLQDGYFTSTIAYMLNARLSNYFEYDFGSSPRIPAFEIGVETNHLAFKVGDKIELPVSIKFREPGITVKLPDTANGEEMWGIRLISPSGERISSEAKLNRIGKPPNTELIRQQYRALPDFKIAEVSVTRSYSRVLSLSGLANFSKPGIYRIRLCYNSIDWAWEHGEHEAHGIKTDLWAGSFCSPVFTVTIRP